MALSFDTRYPSVDDLRDKAQKRIPRFAFEYLDGGCNEDINLHRNTSELREITLKPRYIKDFKGSTLKTTLFGHEYDAPFGVAPVGLQGLMWPNSPEILAKAAHKHNLPFILSTVTTMDIERASELTEGKAWFQLYNPAEDAVRFDIIDRAAAADCPVLVLLCDVPTFGYRPRDFKNGLALPPKMTLNNILQILGKPNWAIQTLKHGIPTFETLRPYTPEGLNLKQLGKFMDKTFSGRLNEERIKPIRDRWKGKLVLKGVASEEDTEQAIRLGFDGIIVSNHGGRQLDAGESTVAPLSRIAAKYKDQITVMMDSGMRSGPDMARALASGAEFTFMGRSFMYGAAAMGKKGGDHTMTILKVQLQQIMDQLCCENIEDLHQHLIT
ncbi:alpha-hydroxy acid oxidase [Flagellimonas zhangzhouensis]|uniref:L-lactate dehydrogenase (Cytochrome) n=1 Tax=Flagellimonas zhangzhouensis TaxID=1073328 RepID=A0A1H2T1U5_9FLAO|nr:alpha-hydroxy acid oxidase [Allomuricauda zhangzhouensis]SDQ81984.1 L-lactate dehydrogenase (cytochrome) [Allomuricauda zhangzhouensis]SDW37259.1 L-lactate dehydrogenase (cytochrome) [Allomuricauda zhangzhouensis]